MIPSAEVLFQNSSDAIVMLDEQFCFVGANDKAGTLYRRPVTQLIGSSIFDFFPAVSNAENSAREKLVQAQISRAPIKFEAFLPGLFSWHSILAVPASGKLSLFLEDITDRVRRQQDAAVKATVTNIVQDLPLAIAITRGREHRLELVNEVVRRLWARRALEGERVERVLPEAREQGFIDLLDSVYASGKRFDGPEMPLSWDPDGSGVLREAISNLIYQPLFATSGEVNGIVHVGIDVTAQVAERKLMARQASERAAVLDQLREGIIITDGDGKINFVNAAARHLHGVAVLGVTPSAYTQAYSLLTEEGLLPPTDALPLTRAVATNEPVVNAKWKIRRPDGSEVCVIGSATPVHNEQQERIACVLTMHEFTEPPS